MSLDFLAFLSLPTTLLRSERVMRADLAFTSFSSTGSLSWNTSREESCSITSSREADFQLERLFDTSSRSSTESTTAIDSTSAIEISSESSTHCLLLREEDRKTDTSLVLVLFSSFRLSGLRTSSSTRTRTSRSPTLEWLLWNHRIESSRRRADLLITLRLRSSLFVELPSLFVPSSFFKG